MNPLETEVREALICRKAGELFDIIQRPDYADLMKEGLGKMFGQVSDKLYESEDPFDDLDETFDEVLKNPTLVRQISYQQAQNQYMTRAEFEKRLDFMYTELSKNVDFDDDVIKQLKDASNGIISYVIQMNEMIDDLVDIAKSKGIEQAILKSSWDGVIRDHFPEADDYRRFVDRGMDAAKEYLTESKKAVADQGDTGKMLSSLYSDMQSMIETVSKAHTNLIEQEIDRIYG